MAEINMAAHTPDNFFAGSFPIATDFGTVKAGAAIRARAPVVKNTDGELEEAAASTISNIVGISAAESSNGEAVYYLTGEFFTQAITLPAGITAEALKPVLRKLCIFSKEVQINA